MKKIYLFFLILLFTYFNAQIVNIPDVAFKNFLLTANVGNSYAKNPFGLPMKIDTNSDGEIQLSEADNVGQLSTEYYPGRSNIHSIGGIASFNNLNYLYLYKSSLTSLDVGNIANLHTLRITYNTLLTSLNINGNSSLAEIYSEHNNILNYNLQSASLTKIVINNQNSSQPLNSLNISNCPNLEFIELQKTSIPSFDFSNRPALEYLKIAISPLTTNINLTGCINLNHLTIQSTALSSLQLNNYQNLESLNLFDNPISSLSITNCPNIENFFINSSNLTAISLSNLPLLRHFASVNNNFTEIDLSLNPLLENITIYDHPVLNRVNLKSGGTALNVLSWFHINNNNPNLKHICCDDADFPSISNYLSINGLNNIVLNSYCSFTPGGTYYTVTGNTKYDIDNNGCNINDVSKPLQKFTITSGSNTGNTIADSSGNYSIALQAGSHMITPIAENPTYWTISPNVLTVNFPTQTSPLPQNFCFAPNGIHNDLEIAIIPITAAVPGFTSKYKIIYKNKGTAAQSGNLAFSYDDNLMNFTTATVAPASQSTGTLTWNFTNLLPFEAREVTVTFTLNTPTATPPLTGGHILNYTAQVTGATDETPADNNFTLNQTVLNSFDPNDKTCLQGTAIAQAQVGDYVHYLIRFENTGTANAQNVVVKDIIDTSKFNLSSLVAVGGSHSFVTRITGPNTVEFIFENIQLPFADATNDGYVVFKIRTLTNLTVGNAFSNTANIYFDYNAPIVTNTYTTTVQSNLSTTETATEDFSIYPNPVKDLLHFKTKERIVKAEVYDLSGRIVRSFGITQNAINLSELSKGNYLIRIYTKDQVIIKKLIKD